MMGPIARALILASVLTGVVVGSASRALATTITVPTGYEAEISNALLGGCNANSYGYQIGTTGAQTQLGTKALACTNPVPAPDATAGPVDSPQTVRLYLQDSSCSGATYYSDGTGTKNHALVVTNSNTSYSVAIDDGGANCNIWDMDYTPTSATNANFTATVTIVAAPPAVTVTALTPPSGQSGYFNSADLAANGGNIPVAVSATEGTGKGMKSISCTDNGVAVPVVNVTGVGTETMTGAVAVSADGSHAISCLGASNVSATGNTGGNNTATVDIDSTSPQLTVPASPFVVRATSLSGAQLSSYAVSASDPDDSPSLSCIPTVPALFPIGDTTVSCHAVDRAGNASTAQFVVRVPPPPPASPSVASVTVAGSTAMVTVTCTGVSGQACSGMLVGTALETQPARHATDVRAMAKTATRSVVVAGAAFSVAAGGRVTLRILLNVTGRELLGKLYRLTATFTFIGGSGGSVPAGIITFSYSRIHALFNVNASDHPSFTTFSDLTLSGIPKKGQVTTACRGGGCPFSRQTTRHKTVVNAAKLLGGAHLVPGATVEVTISAVNMVGEVAIWTIHAGALPTEAVLCLPPGRRQPVKCAA
jgi:hypothetical protein